METWFVILASFCVATIIKCILMHSRDGKKLPPGPSFLLSNFILLTNSLPELQSIIKNLKSKYGPLITLSIGSHPSIFVGSHSLTHEVLIQKGATFSDRPKTPLCGISTASYGPTWRLFRHNLASNFLHTSQVKSYTWARKSVLGILIGRLQEHMEQEALGINVVEHFEDAMLRLSVMMCFGDKLDHGLINAIASVQRRLLDSVGSFIFKVYMVSPCLAKILFRNKWKNFHQLCEDQKQLFIPLIKSRTDDLQSNREEQIMAYVDTLVKLEIPKEEATNNGNGGKLNQKDIVSMCGEFLVAGVESTSNAIQWIMANLVKHPHIQSKLYNEIVKVVGPPPPPPQKGSDPESVINEKDLQKMPYLKAVVLEGLRRHPPGYLVLPHRVSEEVELQGYLIPKGATINFMVAEMGWDPKVWEDPMEFKPERFLLNSNGVFDITGRKGIKMMPFGAGRRICPGSDLALLHLQYFVANLIWYFRWTSPHGNHVDLSEEVGFTVVMKNPLQTQIYSRTKN